MTDIQAGIIDQRVRKIAESLEGYSGAHAVSSAFVLLCIQALLDLDEERARDCLVDGGGNAGIDGLFLGPVHDGEIDVTLFQGNYRRMLDGIAHFPENEVLETIHTLSALFDPGKPLHVNDALRPKMEEIRALIADGNIPNVRVVLCNNGLRWKAEAQAHIDRAGFGDQVVWEHLNHSTLVGLLQRTSPADDSVVLKGQILVENFAFRRVLIGRILVTEVKALMDRWGDRLLERKLRRYLGPRGRVNEGIRGTLGDPHQAPDIIAGQTRCDSEKQKHRRELYSHPIPLLVSNAQKPTFSDLDEAYLRHFGAIGQASVDFRFFQARASSIGGRFVVGGPLRGEGSGLGRRIGRVSSARGLSYD